MRTLRLGLLVLITSIVSAETVGPYMCTATDTGKLIVGPYSCTAGPNGATIATVTVTVDPKVSALNRSTYRFVQNLTPTSVGSGRMVIAGSVPEGTPCDITQKLTFSGVEYFRIDRTTPGLIWSSNNQPPTVWAQCK